METAFENEISPALALALSKALRVPFAAASIRLPAKRSDASAHLPHGAAAAPALCADYGKLYGVSLVERIRLVNGWLLFDFSDAFYQALVTRVNAALPLPLNDGSDHAVNRMLVLARHEGTGCPDGRAFHQALLEAVVASQSPAAYRRAARSAETLFHEIPPRERPAVLRCSGSLGGALARLLSSAGLEAARP
ncbi:MAG: hypothetical protein VB034_04470 [Eubacteriales bacterium]|nr:hypothetical protein [Eubacteriales bacterium]